MKRKLKLLVTDVDGTFLDSNSVLPAENILAVKRLASGGIRTVICTGRISSYAGELVQAAGTEQIVVSCNGAVLYDFAGQKILYKKSLAADAVRQITDFCLAQKIDVCAYAPTGAIFHSRNSTRILIFQKYNDKISKNLDLEAGKNKTELQKIPLYIIEENRDFFSENEICKFLIFSENETEMQKLRQFLQKIDVCAVSSMTAYLDVMASGVSKGDGLKRLAKIFGVAADEICAVGDNQNDIAMFSVAGVAVCLANGHAEAQKAATFVTRKTNSTGGFAEAAEFALRYNAGL